MEGKYITQMQTRRDSIVVFKEDSAQQKVDLLKVFQKGKSQEGTRYKQELGYNKNKIWMPNKNKSTVWKLKQLMPRVYSVDSEDHLSVVCQPLV